MIKALVIGAAVGYGLFVFADYALSIPDVYVSYETNQCVQVLNYAEGDTYSCENMPTKFNHVWVQ